MVARRLSHSALLSQLYRHPLRSGERKIDDAHDRDTRGACKIKHARHVFGLDCNSKLPAALARRPLASARHYEHGVVGFAHSSHPGLETTLGVSSKFL